MGTRFELWLGPDEAARLHAIGEEALGEIARLDRQLSVYRPSSDVSWINARASQTAARAVAVVGGASFECDALSTALLVLGADRLAEFGRRFPAFEAVVV